MSRRPRRLGEFLDRRCYSSCAWLSTRKRRPCRPWPSGKPRPRRRCRTRTIQSAAFAHRVTSSGRTCRWRRSPQPRSGRVQLVLGRRRRTPASESQAQSTKKRTLVWPHCFLPRRHSLRHQPTRALRCTQFEQSSSSDTPCERDESLLLRSSDQESHAAGICRVASMRY